MIRIFRPCLKYFFISGEIQARYCIEIFRINHWISDSMKFENEMDRDARILELADGQPYEIVHERREVA